MIWILRFCYIQIAISQSALNIITYVATPLLPATVPTPRVSAGGSSSSSLHVTLEMLEGLQYSVTIIGYQVEYRERGDGDWIPKMVDATSYRHSFNLTELNVYTTYEIRAAVRVLEFASESLAFSNVLPATTFEGGVYQMGCSAMMMMQNVLLCNHVRRSSKPVISSVYTCIRTPFVTHACTHTHTQHSPR